MAMFYFAEEDDDVDNTNDNNDNGGVQLPESNQPSPSNEAEPPHHPDGDDDVTFLTGPASQQSTSTVDVLLPPLDEEPNDRPEINVEGYEPIPPDPDQDVQDVQNEAPANAEVPLVPVEEHIPGVNDMMSGAVSLLDQVSTNMDQDDNIVCANELVRQRMPFKVLRRDELFHQGLPFVEDKWLWELPREFMATYRGLDRAVEEFNQYDEEEFESDVHADLALLAMIAKRGGRTERRFQQVVYPEDIIPFPARDHPLQGLPQWRTGQDMEDGQYWMELGDQGLVWNELYIP